MKLPLRPSAAALALAGALATAVLLPTGAAAAPARGCPSFASQSDAQAYFFNRGGTPRKGPRRLDPDRDGVACERLRGPHAGFATIGYNKRGGFFYGYARMPTVSTSADGFACLHGNRGFPDGPRTLGVYRLPRNGAKPLQRRGFSASAEADPATGALSWKLPARNPRGRYFAAFQARIPLSPYGRVQCPGFRSHAIRLPKPR